MANFQQHFWYGVITTTLCSLAGYLQFGLTRVQALCAAFLGTLASLAPDLDHPEGVPGKVMADALSALAPIGFVLYLPLEYRNRFALEHWIVLFFTVHLSVKYFYFYLIARLTDHRGMFHSIPSAILCGELVCLMFCHLPWLNRLTIAVICSAGYLTHLVLDEIYSVEWAKMETKRSLGTALDLGDFREFSTWLVYLLMLLLAMVLYHQYNPLNPVSSWVRETLTALLQMLAS